MIDFRMDPPADGFVNMAADAALVSDLDRVEAACRVYSWTGSWITLGKNQNPERDLRLECPVPFTFRPTGGRAVLHGHDATVGMAIRYSSLAAGQSAESVSRSVRTAYRFAVGPLIEALRGCGVDACLGEEYRAGSGSARSSDCFAAISPNDIFDRRTLKKICGVALAMGPSGVLLQASIPLGPPLVDPALVFSNPAIPFWSELDLVDFSNALEGCLKRTIVARKT